MQRLNDLAEKMPALPRCAAVGVSGGADSVALLHLLLVRGCEVQAVHVNHGLRGAASDGDEAFVRALCSSLHVPLITFRLEPPENPGEDWARKERYRCFREAMARTGAQALALAHHRDDQAETLLLHLMRGAGLTGLTGMAAETDLDGMRVLRPLLGFTQQELRDALTEEGISWREDASNQDSRYLRNAVRTELLPLMERLSPGCSERMAAAAEILQADDAALQGSAEAFVGWWAKGGCLMLEPLLKQPEGLQRRILRCWWRQNAGNMDERNLSREQTERLLRLTDCKAGTRCNLPGGWHGWRGWTHLHLVSPVGTGMAPVRPVGEIPQDCVIRTRQAGDWLTTRAGRRSLQDFLTDRKVDAPFRDRIPLLCRGSEVLAVAGIWQQDVLLRWHGEMPWAQQPYDTQNKKGE